MKESDIRYFMTQALGEAHHAESLGEVPVGAVIVYQGKIIARGYNRRETDQSPLAHAECLAMMQAAQVLDSWRLADCQLFVTLEPCPMCAGAIVQARIPEVYIAAKDPKAGAAGSIYQLLQDDRLNHQARVITGCLEEASRYLLQRFFKNLRQEKKERRRRCGSDDAKVS